MATERAVEPPPVLEQIGKLDDNWLMCRDLRHAYAVEVPYHAVVIEGGQRGARYSERTLACMRCNTKRIELVRIHSTWIERLDVWYERPKGYDIKGARREAHVLGMVRLEQLRRAMGEG